ncbi:MAG: DUF58 domain-containing protein [Myxococcota bacterium]|nr:DUF58 domain-containing protein [Myxococcota bacterium]
MPAEPEPSPYSPQHPLLQLTSAGKGLLLAGVAFLAAGVFARSWTFTLWGVLLLGTTLLAAAAGRQLLAALLAGGVEARCRHLPLRRRPPLALDRPYPLELSLRSHLPRRLPLRLRLTTSPFLEVGTATEQQLWLAPGCVLVPWEVIPRRLGASIVQGLQLEAIAGAGLCSAQVYWPLELPLRLLDGQPHGAHPPRQGSRRALPDRAGSHRLRQAGLGTDFRELRDHYPGDPFRSIEWKASARHRRLLVREVESEVVLGLSLLLDLGPAAHQGNAGRTPLLDAVGLLTELARIALAAQDRVGLTAYDRRIYADLPPAAGPKQLRRLAGVLAGLTAIVDEDLAPTDEVELARYLAGQLTARFGLTITAAGLLAAQPLPPAFRHLLDQVEGADRGPGRRWLEWPRPAASPGPARLRELCQVLGIPLPYRPAAGPTDWAEGLAASLTRVSGRARGGHQALVLSPLTGATSGPDLAGAIRLARRRGVRLAFLQLPPTGGTEAAARDWPARLATSLLAAEQLDASPAAAELRRLGVPVWRRDPRTTGEQLYQRLLTRRQP